MAAENFWSEINRRIYNVTVEGREVLKDVDIFSTVGANTAYDQTITDVEVADGIIDIHFDAIVDQPVICGIVVEGAVTGMKGELEGPPQDFRLSQNYPNPFNDGTTIRFALDVPETVTLRVFDLLGRTVAEQSLGTLSPGDNDYYWRAVDKAEAPLTSGVYFYYIEGSLRSKMQKLMLLK